MNCFWIYMLECDDGSYYTGYTKNLTRRYRQHVEGKASVKYTRTHRPVRIAQCWRVFDTVGTALKIESYIKGRPRAIKESLVEDPARLKEIASKALDKDLNIFADDPATFEENSRALAAGDQRRHP